MIVTSLFFVFIIVLYPVKLQEINVLGESIRDIFVIFLCRHHIIIQFSFTNGLVKLNFKNKKIQPTLRTFISLILIFK